MSGHVTDFNTRNKLLTAKLLNQDYRYHKLHKAFSKFCRRHFDLVSKFKSFLQQGLSDPKIYSNLVNKFRKKIYACTQFRKIILRFIKIGYHINVMRQTARKLTLSRLITLLPSLVACRWVGPQTLWRLRPKDFQVSQLVSDALALVGSTGVLLLVFSCFSISVISFCRVLIVVSSVYSFDFYVREDVALMG